MATFELPVLEDLYLPYKQKRKTKATVAKEAGVEPLANWPWDCGHGVTALAPEETPETRALAFCDADTGVPDVAAALAGAADILVERLSEDARLRQTVRVLFLSRDTCGPERARRPSRAAGSRTTSPFTSRSPSC